MGLGACTHSLRRRDQIWVFYICSQTLYRLSHQGSRSYFTHSCNQLPYRDALEVIPTATSLQGPPFCPYPQDNRLPGFSHHSFSFDVETSSKENQCVGVFASAFFPQHHAFEFQPRPCEYQYFILVPIFTYWEKVKSKQ